MNTTVARLRKILEAAVDTLNNYPDEAVVSMVENTYFVKTPFIGTHAGFVGLDNIEDQIECPDDDEEDE